MHNPRVTDPVPVRTLGDVPADVADIAEQAFAGLGFTALVLAGGDSQAQAEWVLTRGWADLDRGEAPELGHRFPIPGATVLVTATAVLKLVADGTISGGCAVLGQLVADVAGLPYADAAVRLVLGPLELADSSFPARPADIGARAVTGYNLTREGRFEPVPARIPTLQAVAGLWSTGADLVRLGLGSAIRTTRT